MIKVSMKGNFKDTKTFLEKLHSRQFYNRLEYYAKKGVEALESATPTDTGKTRESWNYKIEINDKHALIAWDNDNKTKDGVPIVVLLQYGHGTRNGGYVSGRDFINPAISPVFDQIVEMLEREVKSL